MESLLQDLRYGFRMLRKSPAFTVVAVLTLALGIGANTAVFTIVNAELLRPLPYDHPEQLVKIWGQYSKQGIPQNWISEPEWWDMRASLQSFSALSAYTTGGGVNFTREGNDAMRITTNSATADLFPLLGVTAARGRVFNAEEDQPGRDHVAVLDYGFWTSQMASDPSVVGHTVQLNGEAYTIVGILPKGFHFGEDANLWLPIALDKAKPNNRGSHYLEVIGRLKPGVTLPQAGEDIKALVQSMTKQFPQNYRPDSGFGMFLRPLHEELVGDTRLGLIVVFAAVCFVLLIACINLANLSLARGSVRSREIAVRGAMGASRFRLIQQLITESLAVALVGGALGILLAVWATQVLWTIAAKTLPNTGAIAIDGRVLAFAVGITFLTGVLFGIAPALQLSRPRLFESLKDAARGSTSGGGHQLRGGLVVAEISMAVVLLVAAGLLVRSLGRLLQVSPGFTTEHLLTLRVSLPQAQYRDMLSTLNFYRDLEAKIQNIPGVKAAGMTSLLPMTGRNSSGSTFVEQTSQQGIPVLPLFNKPFIEADQRRVSAGYFQSMQIPLVSGRMFSAADEDPGGAPVAIVDEEFARRFWPDREAIGQRIAVSAVPNSNPPVPLWRTVVGVVGHVKNNALDKKGREQVYVTVGQGGFPSRGMYLTLRATGDPISLASSVQREVKSIDATLPVFEVKTMDEWLDTTVSPRRFNMALLVAFGALALTLAAIGTYGVISYSVSQRTQEIGIRMALGATQTGVLRMVIEGGLRLAAAGVAIGAVLAVVATRLMASMLFGVRSTDPLTFIAVVVILMATALFAAYVPARRATRVDPMIALRYE